MNLKIAEKGIIRIDYDNMPKDYIDAK